MPLLPRKWLLTCTLVYSLLPFLRPFSKEKVKAHHSRDLDATLHDMWVPCRRARCHGHMEVKGTNTTLDVGMEQWESASAV